MHNCMELVKLHHAQRLLASGRFSALFKAFFVSRSIRPAWFVFFTAFLLPPVVSIALYLFIMPVFALLLGMLTFTLLQALTGTTRLEPLLLLTCMGTGMWFFYTRLAPLISERRERLSYLMTRFADRMVDARARALSRIAKEK